MSKSTPRIQYVTDDSGKTVSVILDIQYFEEILERLEDLDDIEEYRRMKPLVEEDIRANRYYSLDEVLKLYNKM